MRAGFQSWRVTRAPTAGRVRMYAILFLIAWLVGAGVFVYPLCRAASRADAMTEQAWAEERARTRGA